MSDLRITDHALVRWLERAASAAEQVKAGHYVILADGLVYVVRESRLVTVIEDDGRNARVRALCHQPDETTKSEG